MSEVVEEQIESLVIPDPDPENKIEVYLHGICSMLGVMIEQQNDLITVFTRASEPEPPKGKKVKLMDGSEISFR